MPTKRIASFKHGRCRQRGASLLIMLVILVVGIAAVLVNSLTSSTVKIARQEKTAAALAQAKDALIGFAITYSDTHSGQVFGHLPCPDKAGGNPEGSAEPSCGIPNVSVIGRLPWKTLGLPTLRDGDGECLWYAVSGTYKNNPPPPPATGLMNWDTEGQFQAFAAAGTPLTNQNQVVAVIFAPGAPLSGQNRSGTTAPVCGGNYTASNYLDSDATIGADNAALSSTTSPPAANASSQFFTAGATTKINDQMMFITKQDIWNAIKKRNDFGAFVAKLLVPLFAYSPTTVDFSTTPTTETTYATPGCLRISRVSKALLYPFPSNPNDNDWQDNVLYARPTGSCTITVNGATSPCPYGVVIFPGERNTGQTRITNTDKNTWSNYLEGANLTAFTYGTTTTGTTHNGTISFSGATSYSAASPSTDVLACE